MAARGTPEERFSRYVRKTRGCWRWTGAKHKGYGQFQVASRSTVRAHRWAYEHWVGPIPDGFTLDHTCHDPKRCTGGDTCPHRACVNPKHLVPSSAGDNSLRGNGPAAKAKRATHCQRGHRLGGKNANRPGSRECRKCARQRARAAYVPRPRQRITTCSKGHPLDGVKKDGRRFCTQCTRDYQREYQRARRRTLRAGRDMT